MSRIKGGRGRDVAQEEGESGGEKKAALRLYFIVKKRKTFYVSSLPFICMFVLACLFVLQPTSKNMNPEDLECRVEGGSEHIYQPTQTKPERGRGVLMIGSLRRSALFAWYELRTIPCTRYVLLFLLFSTSSC